MNLAILGKDFTLQLVFIAIGECLEKNLDPTLNFHISCYIIDTVEGCNQWIKAASEFVWWESPLATIQVQKEKYYLMW